MAELLSELDALIAAQARLQFQQGSYDEDAAEAYGVALLDFMRLRGVELRGIVASALPHQTAGGEPVAWMYDYTDEHGVPQRDFTTEPFLASWVSAKKAKATPLYDHPPAIGIELIERIAKYAYDHAGWTWDDVKADIGRFASEPRAVGQEWEKVVRAWRNRFISQRTGYYQAQGQCYEEAIANAEYDANCYADGLAKAGIGASQ